MAQYGTHGSGTSRYYERAKETVSVRQCPEVLRLHSKDIELGIAAQQTIQKQMAGVREFKLFRASSRLLTTCRLLKKCQRQGGILVIVSVKTWSRISNEHEHVPTNTNSSEAIERTLRPFDCLRAGSSTAFSSEPVEESGQSSYGSFQQSASSIEHLQFESRGPASFVGLQLRYCCQ